MRKLLLAALLAVPLALALALGAIPQASAQHSAAQAQRSCFVGNLSWSVGPAGQTPTRANTVLDTADSPAGCMQVLTRVLSTGGSTTRSGLIRNPGTATAYVKDGTAVAKAWAEKQPYKDSAGRRCKQTYPNVEVNWHACTG